MEGSGRARLWLPPPAIAVKPVPPGVPLTWPELSRPQLVIGSASARCSTPNPQSSPTITAVTRVMTSALSRLRAVRRPGTLAAPTIPPRGAAVKQPAAERAQHRTERKVAFYFEIAPDMAPNPFWGHPGVKGLACCVF